jgi:hypothetical protein
MLSLFNEQRASTQRQEGCDVEITDAAQLGFVTAVPDIFPAQLAEDTSMTHVLKIHSHGWLKPADVRKPNVAPSQVDFYALLGAAYLLLIAGGMCAICLSVASLAAG